MNTCKSDLDGLRRGGAEARKKGGSFYDNPLFTQPGAPGEGWAA